MLFMTDKCAYRVKVELLVEFTELRVEDSSDNDRLATPFAIFYFDFVSAALGKPVQKAPASITSSFQVPSSSAKETKPQLAQAAPRAFRTDNVQQRNAPARVSQNLERPIATSSASRVANTAHSLQAQAQVGQFEFLTTSL